MYIVQLEKGVWLAPWSGYPGRTLQEKYAVEYEKVSTAKAALTKARQYRPFNTAVICNTETQEVIEYPVKE